MARIVLATTGSFGDLHPMIALAIELRKRGHSCLIASWEGYRKKVNDLGFEFHALRPDADPTDRELIRKTMDAVNGTEVVIKEIIFPSLREMYDDLLSACDGADVIITGELVYAVASVVEKTGIKWISTSLAPISMFSFEDPSLYPGFHWMEILRPMPAFLNRALFSLVRMTISDWYEPYKRFRQDLGLSTDHDPIFDDKFSKLLHLTMFSKALGRPQSDWPTSTLQTGFCFYDESESGSLDVELSQFLDAGEPPIVFTLGTAAVLDAGDFFDESAKAAKLFGRRAVLLYGRDNETPKGLDENIAAFPYAPYSQVFPKAACVVHQAGVGTTAQVLRAGVPHLIMPYSHDQPDNAARCRRAGVAEIISRDDYNAASSAKALEQILSNRKYRESAAQLKRIVNSENGTVTACDAIELILRK